MQVTLDIPDDLAPHLIPPGRDAARTLLEDVAIKAFSTSRISRAQLRSLLHFETRYELDGFLKQHGIGFDAYGAEDLEHDVRTVHTITKHRL